MACALRTGRLRAGSHHRRAPPSPRCKNSRAAGRLSLLRRRRHRESPEPASSGKLSDRSPATTTRSRKPPQKAGLRRTPATTGYEAGRSLRRRARRPSRARSCCVPQRNALLCSSRSRPCPHDKISGRSRLLLGYSSFTFGFPKISCSSIGRSRCSSCYCVAC